MSLRIIPELIVTRATFQMDSGVVHQHTLKFRKPFSHQPSEPNSDVKQACVRSVKAPTHALFNLSSPPPLSSYVRLFILRVL